MAADQMQRDSGKELGVAVVELDSPGVNAPHHAGDVLCLEGAAVALFAHVAPGRVLHLQVLQVQRRRGKQLEIADVVVVQVRDHDILDRRRIDAEQAQAVRRATQVLASALGSHCRGKTGVDHQLAPAAAHQPDEVVERHRTIVRVAADEVLARAARVVRVLDRVDFVQRRAHAR